MVSLGEKIKNARKEKGMTLKGLGEITGLTHGYLSNLETNKRQNPSLEVLMKISDALTIPRSELIPHSRINEEIEDRNEHLISKLHPFFVRFNSQESCYVLVNYKNSYDAIETAANCLGLSGLGADEIQCSYLGEFEVTVDDGGVIGYALKTENRD